MKAFTCLAMLFVGLFCYAIQPPPQISPTPTSTPTPTPTNLDIILEGPWLLYVDTKSFDQTVLVALSPDASNQSKPHTFHYPYISMGDGYPFKNDIYCLLLDGRCGSKNNKTKLASDNYDTPAPLTVYASQSWDWRRIYTYYGGTALILPMPDTYSNDETWPMRFAKTFDSGGNGYNEQSLTPNHSIGLLLHYVSGISYVDIYRCDFSQQTTLANCALNIVAGHQLNNTGTLQIVMKAPNDSGDDVCDLHVRNTYPQMLQLVDGDNGDIKVIDPARSIDAKGKGNYDDTTVACLDKDKTIQGVLPPASSLDRKGHKQQNMLSNSSKEIGFGLSNRLGKIIADLRAIPSMTDKDSSLPDNIKKIVDGSAKSINRNADEIEKASAVLQNKGLPRMSQLSLIRFALQASQNVMQKLKGDIKREEQANVDRSKDSSVADLLGAIETIKKNQAKAATSVPSKDGKDCRAPIMLVQIK